MGRIRWFPLEQQTMNYVGFPIAGFLAAILVLFPLPRLIRAHNIAGIALVFWIFQYCIIISVNTIIWAGNSDNSAPTWCKLCESPYGWSHMLRGLMNFQRTNSEMLHRSPSLLRPSVSASTSNSFPPGVQFPLAYCKPIENLSSWSCVLQFRVCGCF